METVKLFSTVFVSLIVILLLVRRLLIKADNKKV